MPQQVVHSESHLYPCLLGSVNQCSERKFLFYSPLNSYGSCFNCANEQTDYFDLEMRKYSSLESIGNQIEGRQVAIFGNEDHFTVRNETDESSIASNIIQIPKGDRIVSNMIALSHQVSLNRANSLKKDLWFLTVKNVDQSGSQGKDSEQECLQLNLLNLSSAHQAEMNPEETSLQKQQLHQNRNDPIKCSFQIPFALGQNSSASFQSYQLIEDKFNSGYEDRSFFLFDKKSSVVHHLNLCSDIYLDQIIQCDTSSEYDRKTQFQSNKIAQLSHNLLINYDSNGLVKLIDTRHNRVAQVRDLIEQMNVNGEFNLLAKQQNHVKFYDNDRNLFVTSPAKPTSKFLINLNNEIVEIDLRSNQTNQKITFYKSTTQGPIGNYEMSVQNGQRFFAYTSEAHCSFKGIVVKQTLS